jgi:hypothetical protein
MPIFALKITSHMKDGWRCKIANVADIADQIRASDESIASLAAGPYDFWTTTSLQSFHQQTNPLATNIFYKASTFNARQTPLLSGVVVITGRDGDGQLASVSDEAMEALVDSAYEPGLGMCQLEVRLWRALRREKRRRRAEREELNKLRSFAY